MAAELKYTCDVCGTVKGASNHWHRVQIVVRPDGMRELFLSAWSPVESDNAGWKHLCGHTCVIRQVDAFMSEGSVPGTIPEWVSV